MLDAIRKRSGSWIVRILLLLLVASFAVWGIGDMIRGPGANTPAVSVGDVDISIAEFDQAFRRELERLQPLFGGRLDSTQAFRMGIGDSVASRLATGALFDQEARRLGLLVPNDVVRRHIEATEAFHGIRGSFDRAVFQQTLLRAGLDEGRYVAMLKQDIGRDRLSSGVAAGLTPPDIMVDLVFRHRGERRVAEIIAVPLPPAPTAVPSDEAVETFWRENQELFMLPEYRALTVLLIDIESLAAEAQVEESAIRQVYDERRSEFDQPEWRTVDQVVFQTEEAARRARSAIDQGRDLAAAAGESGETGVTVLSLGRVRKGDLPPELGDATFALAEGAVTVPLPSPLGWHLVKVGKIEAGRRQTFEEVRDDLAKLLAREKALDSLYRLSNQLQDEIASGATLEDAAQRLGQSTLRVEAVDNRGLGPDGKPAADGKLSRDVLRAAFATAEKTDSGVVEGSDDTIFVVRVDQVTPRKARDIAEARNDILAAMAYVARDTAARDRAEALAERLKAGTAAATLAQTENLAFRTTQPVSRADSRAEPDLPGELVASLFGIKIGETSIARGQDVYLVARLAEIRTPDPAAEQAAREALKARLAADMSGDILNQYGHALEKRYPVRINRDALAQRYAER